MKQELTSTMKQAVKYAKQHGGKIQRKPGGYWGPFGTTTIDGLVRRGAAVYSDHRKNSRGEFPVEITLVDVAGMGAGYRLNIVSERRFEVIKNSDGSLACFYESAAAVKKMGACFLPFVDGPNDPTDHLEN